MSFSEKQQSICAQIIENNSPNSFFNTTIINSLSDVIIKVPFPPKITPQELAQNKIGKKKSKNLNAFIVYRKQYLEQMHRLGLKPNMVQLSRKAGSAWEKEPQKVKKWYKDLAEKVVDILTERQIKSSDFVENDWNIYTCNVKQNVKERSNFSIKTQPETKRIEYVQPQELESTFESPTISNLEISPLNFPLYIDGIYGTFSLMNDNTTTLPQQFIESNPDFSSPALFDFSPFLCNDSILDLTFFQ
ncbi:2595_t:CDS:1 [Ambispora leptoticha]|uniref:2595_t:CDS:1 n=1 Tax=Ambispora leptoticha TaxID=144679 RepID=A0A9N8YV02_9GLOM|nr:2595_t:CDS:1 [Ambispora leptoticha]